MERTTVTFLIEDHSHKKRKTSLEMDNEVIIIGYCSQKANA